MPATNEDLARLLVSVELSASKVEKSAASIARAAERSARKMDADFRTANDNIARGAEQTTNRVVKSFGAQKAAAQNLGFQLNDIATQLASGTSPLRVMAQQGGQVAQALQQAGGARAGIGALAAAFTGLLNPIGLVSVGLIGVTGYAVQYFAQIIAGGDKSAEALQKQAELVQKVGEKYKDQMPALAQVAEMIRKIADEQERVAAADAGKEYLKADLQKQFDELTQAQTNAISLVPEANRLYTILAGKLEAGAASAADFQLVIDELDKVLATNKSAELEAARSALVKMKEVAAETASQITSIDAESRKLNVTLDEAKGIAEALVAQMLGIGTGGASAIGEAANAIVNTFIPSVRQAIAEMGELAVATSKLGYTTQGGPARYIDGPDLPATAPIPDKRPDPYLYGDPEESGKRFGKAARDEFESLNGGAISRYVDQVVKAESGGRANARNPNSSATGLGQFIESTWLRLFKENFPDTAKNMTKAEILAYRNNADASRALIEAYARENAGLLQKAGVSVNEAALHLAHFLGPQGAISVLKAAPNTPVSSLLSPVAIRANPSILGGGATAGSVLAYAQNRAGMSGAGPWGAELGGINSATDAMRAYNEEQQRAAQLAQEVGSTLAGAFSGLVQDLMSGKDAGEAFANMLSKIGQKLMDMALNQPFQSLFKNLTGGIGGMGLSPSVASVISGGGIGLFADGGIAAHGRSLPLKTFARGGVSRTAAIFGEAGPEAAVPLPDGRRIPVDIRAPKMPYYGGMGGREGSMHQTNNVSIKVEDGRVTNTGDRTALARNITAAVQEEIVRQQRPGGTIYNQIKGRY